MENKNILDYLNFKSKYDKLAEEILFKVGGFDNIVQFTNCMTRLRITIKDNSKVDENHIKKMSVVKGCVWNTNEFQIIIGGEAYKIKDSLNKIKDKGLEEILETKTVKKSFKATILSFISGVIIPVLPVMITAGLLKGFQSIFEQAGWIEKISISYKPEEISSLLTDYDLFSAVVFCVANIGLSFLGLMFVISTVRYLKGNIMMAAFIGLTLLNPYLVGGLGFKLFSIGAVDIKIQSYGSSMLPMVAAGILFVILDINLKIIIPSTVDIIFRPLLAYLFTILTILFVMGPILGVVESGIYYLITWVGKIPFGIGAGLFAFSWQFLVITGMHTAINGFVNMSINNGQPTVLGLCFTLTVLSQFGAGLGMYFKTKNPNRKKELLGAMPATWFGISEPMLYGFTLPKFKPFLFGCVGAGIGGLIVGASGSTSHTVSAGGIFAIIRVIDGGVYEIVFYLISWIVAISVATTLTICFWKESDDQKSSSKKIIKSLNKKYSLTQKEKNELNTFINSFWDQETTKLFKENYYSILFEMKKLTNLESKLTKLQMQNQHLIKKLKKKLDKNNNFEYKNYQNKFSKNISEIEKLEIIQKDLNKDIALIFNNEKILNKQNEFIKKIISFSENKNFKEEIVVISQEAMNSVKNDFGFI